MMPLLKLKGIYDQRTLDLAKDVGVQAIGLDFRPLSMSFLQQHILAEFCDILLPQVHQWPAQISLVFGRDKDFVIASFLQLLSKKLGEQIVKQVVQLEISEEVPKGIDKIVTDFSVPLWWHIPDLQNIKIGPDQKGIVIPYKLLEQSYQKGGHQALENFSKNIDQVFSHRPQIEISCTWESIPISSIIEIFRPEVLSVAVSSSVELNYRNVDQIKLHRFLDLFGHQWGMLSGTGKDPLRPNAQRMN